MTTVRSRGRSSKSIRTSCCQVPQRQAAADDWHGLGGADHGCALVGVRVGVVVELVVLVLAARRNQPLEHLAQVVDSARLELHRRDRRGRAAHEGERLSRGRPDLLDHPLNLAREVDDVAVPPGRKPELSSLNGHLATLPEVGSEQAANCRDHGVGFLLDLGMSEADNAIAAQLQNPISLTVPLEGERIVVKALAVGFDDQPLLSPEKIYLDAFASDRDLVIASGRGKLARRDQGEKPRLQRASQDRKARPSRRRFGCGRRMPVAQNRSQHRCAATSSYSQRMLNRGDVEHLQHGRPLHRSAQGPLAEHPSEIDDRAGGARAGDHTKVPSFLAMRNRDPMTADAVHASPRLPRRDHFYECR